MSSLSENSRRYSSYKSSKKDDLDLNYDSDFSIHKNKKKATNTRRARSSRSSSRSPSRSRSPSSSTRTGSNLKKKESNKLSNTYTKSQLANEKRRGYSSRSRTRSSSSVTRSRTPTPEIEYRKQMDKQKEGIKSKQQTSSKTSFRSGNGPVRRAANFNKNAYGRVANRRPPQSKPAPAPTGDLNKAARQVLSAQRFKNNELQNKLSEVMNELEALKVENKTLKRLHIREEIALKKHESQDLDISKMIKSHTEEMNVVKELNRKSMKENKRISALLLEREEDLRAYKKKADEMKKIINDKKLLDSVEISRKLDIMQKEMEEYKEKSEKQGQKLELLEKNHKHEMGVEIAAQRELKRRLQLMSEENNELKVKLEEKERALDIANIYTNRQVPFDKQAGNWKGSQLSLQGNQTPSQGTPRNRSRVAADRKRKDFKHQGPLKENEITPSPTVISERRLIDDSPVNKNYNAQTNGHITERPNDEIEDEYEEMNRANKKLEIEAKIMQQQIDLKQKDAAERAKRDREAEEFEKKRRLEEKLRLEEEERAQQEKKRIEEKKKQEEEEERQRRIEEERERERREREDKLKAEEQRKRYISPQLINSLEEKEKSLEKQSQKEDLLAKLGFGDKKTTSPNNTLFGNTTGNSTSFGNNGTNSNSNNYNSYNGNSFNDNYSATLPPKQPQTNSSTKSDNNNLTKFMFDEKTESLHQGKSVVGRDNSKNELLSKLFSDDGTIKNKKSNDSKGDDDFFSSLNNNNGNKNRKKSITDSSSKVTMLPWEAQEVNYNQQLQREKSRAKMDSRNSNQQSVYSYNNKGSPKNEHIDFFSNLNGGMGNGSKSKVNDFSSTNGFNRPKMDNKPSNLFNNTKNSGSYVEDIEEFSL